MMIPNGNLNIHLRTLEPFKSLHQNLTAYTRNLQIIQATVKCFPLAVLIATHN